MFARIADGSLSVAINQHVPLGEVADAHRALAGRQTTGCTVLTV
jgi:NADPH2:quinone reductase